MAAGTTQAVPSSCVVGNLAQEAAGTATAAGDKKLGRAQGPETGGREGSGRFVCQSSCKKQEGSRNTQRSHRSHRSHRSSSRKSRYPGRRKEQMRSASANQRQAAVGGPRGWEPHWDGKRTGFAGVTGVTGVLGYLEGQGLSSRASNCLISGSPTTSSTVVRTLPRYAQSGSVSSLCHVRAVQWLQGSGAGVRRV